MTVIRSLPPRLMSDIVQTTQATMQGYGIVNVPILAEQIRLRNEEDNVALEDIEHAIVRVSRDLHISMEFDRFAYEAAMSARQTS